MRLSTLCLLAICLCLPYGLRSQVPSPSLSEKEKNEVNAALQGLHDAAATTQRMLLYQIAHDLLASEARAFAETTGWGRAAAGQPGGQRFSGDDPTLPASIRVLKPSSLRIWPDRIEIEFGGALHHQGISIFRNLDGGKGTKELGKGVWYYSEGDRMFDVPAPKI